VINYYFQYVTKNIVFSPPSIGDIQKSEKILFSIFTRYGDTIIDLMVIKEFLEVYPKKEYLIICPNQMKPYVNELLPNIECIAFNKRNLFALVKIIKTIKNRSFDIGFNPWSNGLDSSYLISYCEKFLYYKDFKKPRIINHYQVVRKYLFLPDKDWSIKSLKFKDDYRRILICPQSTDKKRSVSNDELDLLIENLKDKYYLADITIASMDESNFRVDCKNFVLEKTEKSSQDFIDLIKSNALIVCPDSGPLHISLALKKDLFFIMKTTCPEIVINSGSILHIKRY
jgi:ADP-heptose:LPS heptosyltransferase